MCLGTVLAIAGSFYKKTVSFVPADKVA
jgi:hypothetical protein